MPLDTTNTTASLRVRTLGQLLAQQFPPREFLLDPVLRQGESMMLWAPTGVGKTMLLLSAALAIAGGGELLGWRVARPWRVLAVDGEMAVEDLQERLRMLAPTVAGLDAEQAAVNLCILARSDQKPGARFPDIASAEGQEEVLRLARQHRADLVLLDNFATLAEVEDENEAAAMNPVLAFLLRLKQERIACVLVHHSGKTGDSFRGSSKLATTFEVILGLKPPQASGAARSAAFTTLWTKFRGAPHPTIAPRDVELTSEAGAMRWNAKAAEDDDARKYAEAVLSGVYSTQAEVAQALGWDASKASRMKARAIGRELLSEKRQEEVFKAAREGRRGEGPEEF